MSYLGKLMTILWEKKCYFFSEETEQIAESAASGLEDCLAEASCGR
jgi:hypothetical protein